MNARSFTLHAASGLADRARVPVAHDDTSQPAPPWARFHRMALLTVGITVCVIVFGAVVRVSGSGAGCGQHWPTCNGAVLLVPATLETLIEYTHRVSSGLLGVGIAGLCIGAFRKFPRPHPTRPSSAASVLLLASEAVFGMLLVRHALVGDDASVARAFLMPLHLVTTLLLLGSVTMVAFFSRPASVDQQSNPRVASGVAVSLAGYLVTAASGALTALGDTVSPVHAVRSLASAPAAGQRALQFLERGRAVHPVLAAIFVVSMLMLLPRLAVLGSPSSQRLSRASLALLAAQGCLGATNILLSAPATLQVLHLLITCCIWVTLVWLSCELLAPRQSGAPVMRTARDVLRSWRTVAPPLRTHLRVTKGDASQPKVRC